MKKTRFLVLLLTLVLLLSAIVISALSSDANTAEQTGVRGDVDGDGIVNTKDVIKLRQYFAAFDFDNGISHVEISADADMDNDGGVNLRDLSLLREFLVNESYMEKLDAEYGSTILLSEKLSGAVNGYYSNDRKMATVSNKNVVIEYPLSQYEVGDGAVKSNNGGEYLSAVSDVFVKNTSGDIFYLSREKAKERMNIYRLGSYYYEFHMLDGRFSNYTIEDETAIDLSKYNKGNCISDIAYSTESGELSFKIQSTTDPYIHAGATLSLSADYYNALEITIASEVATSCNFYIIAGSSTGYNGQQIASVSVIPDGEYHTYIVPLSGLSDYTGTLRGVRIDIGKEVGETIKISSLKAVKTAELAPPVKLDRTYHMYSDKVNAVVRIVANKELNNLGAFGTITKISADTVDKLIVKDGNGTHTSIEGVDWSSAEYIGFDIKGVGTYGHILLPDESSGRLSVELKDGEYVITQEYTLPEGYEMAVSDSVLSGFRMYTDENHTFDEFLRRAEEERHPLTSVSVLENNYGAEYAGYDPFRGAYTFNVKGAANFQIAYDQPYSRYFVSPVFEGVDEDREIYVVTHTRSGHLESGALMSKDGLMLPVDLEVCKNFKGENEEPLYDNGDTAYGEIIFPYVVESGKENSFHVINLYQNWGNVPLKQISSIQFIAPYYHLSYGTTETNCIAPYYVYGKDHWTLPDFRAMSAPFWSSQPQHTSIGRLYFLEYTTSDGNSYASESIDNKITAYGPTYCDIDMNYLSDDGKIKAYYRHMEMPHSDENRTYYELVLEVLDDVSIKDFKNDFAFFSFDGRNYSFKKLGYLNENNECVISDANTANTPNYITLGDNSPYISYFDGPETTNMIEYVNFALVVKDYSFNIGGKDYDGNLVLRDVHDGSLNRMSLTLDLGEITLKKGDKLAVNMILLPWGDPSAENDDNVRRVREDSCIDPYKVDVTVGSVIDDVYLPRVMSENGVAEFTLSGGTDNCVVRVYGFDKLTVPTVLEMIDGEWQEYKLNSEVCEYDGYTVYYDGQGKYSYAFVVDMNGNEPRRFKVTADKNFVPLEEGWTELEQIDMPIEVYVTPENYKSLNITMKPLGSEMTLAEDLSYFRFTGNGTYTESYVSVLTSSHSFDTTGRYLVFKYRAPTDNGVALGPFDVFSSTEYTSPKGDASDFFRMANTCIVDGEWHVVVVDLSYLSSFTENESGEYRANYCRVDVMNAAVNTKIGSDTYIDFAYFGMSDSLEDICALNSDMDSLIFYQNGKTMKLNPATVEVTD